MRGEVSIELLYLMQAGKILRIEKRQDLDLEDIGY